MKSRLPLLLLTVLFFPLIAFAQGVVDPASDLSGFFKQVLDAVGSGNWALVAALAVVAIVWAARTWGGRFWPLLEKPQAGVVLAIVTGIAGAFGNALLAGTVLSGPVIAQLALKGLMIALASMGAWTGTKTLITKAQQTAAASQAGQNADTTRTLNQ